MIINFDRESESIKFFESSKKIIVFIQAANNGMTTFLLNKLKDVGYIFVTQNYKDEIIIDSADKKASEFKDNREEMFDSLIKFDELAMCSTNLFYFVPEVGTFLRNTCRDVVETIKKRDERAKYSFENFLEDYFSYKTHKPLFIIAEHIEKFNVNFLTKLKNIVSKFSEVRLILTCDGSAMRAEQAYIFDEYDVINFCKPSFENAIKIFHGLNLNETAYNKKMYDDSHDILDFLNKYNNKLQELEIEDLTNIMVKKILSYFDCFFNEYFFTRLIEYLKDNTYIDNNVDPKDILKKLIEERIISDNGLLYKYNLEYKKDAQNILFIAFCAFVLEKYKKVNCDVLYYIFKQQNNLLTSEMLVHLALNYTSETILTGIIKSLQEKKLDSIDQYYALYSHLFNLKLFALIPDYFGAMNKNEKKPLLLLKTIAKEKQHLKTSPSIYKRYIKENLKTNIDLACLNEILFLDYSINHKRKYLKLITQKCCQYNIRNFEKSKYYYILQNIVAYYIADSNVSIEFYNESISKASKSEKPLFINNKFAFQINEYRNKRIDQSELESTYLELLNECSPKSIYYSFIDHNIYLYNSLTQQKNAFPKLKEIDNSKTWELFKKLNYYTCKFVFDEVDINEFASIKEDVSFSNRFPSYNFYYYNLFVIAKAFEDKEYIKTATKYLDYNQNFKSLELYRKYKTIKNKNSDYFRKNKAELVKHGLIFSRLFDLDYLLKSLAEITK